MESKEELRTFFLNYRSNLDQEQIDKLSIIIKNRFLELRELKNANNIMVYLSYRNEVKTFGLVKRLLLAEKQVFIPYCLPENKELRISPIKNLESDLVKGTYSIKEPRLKLNSPIEKIDIVVVPAIVFAKNCYRIGYGGGYYDRFLAKLAKKTITIGLIYDCFVVDSLPVGRFDLAVDMVVTEKEIYYNTTTKKIK